ncbi:helix-turn-helix domain-containing protein [Shewanella colwelliana]|uniref:helix-turn-helix domain-containing protein n=1 Tax=Shewanella colwelliana TaxID=23 RepID=UPI0037369845
MWQENLKRFVNLSDKTQEYIALEAGINQGTLSNIITGKRSASIETLEAIVDALGISMLDLFQDIESSKGYKKLQCEYQSSLAQTDSLKSELVELISRSTEKNLLELRNLLPLLQKILR